MYLESEYRNSHSTQEPTNLCDVKNDPPSNFLIFMDTSNLKPQFWGIQATLKFCRFYEIKKLFWQNIRTHGTIFITKEYKYDPFHPHGAFHSVKIAFCISGTL